MVILVMGGTISVAVLFISLTGAQTQQSVTLSSQRLCVVTGSTVTIPCTYSEPYYSSVIKSEWYQVQRSDGEPQDLSKDPQYSGRVFINRGWKDCTLTMYNVKVSDSEVYNFRFRTGSDWISASSGVTLTVTDLQVKVDLKTVRQGEVNLTCSSTCRFSETPHYYWYMNGQYDSYSYGASTVLHSTSVSDKISYSCQVSGSSHISPAVCVLGKECWDVTYTPQSVCHLKGSSVDLSCSYKYPGGHTVIKSFWYIKEQQVGDVEPVDVREEEEYRGRVQYSQSSQNDCRMTLTHLRESDAHTYRFRFHTDQPGGKGTGEPGVSLSVTDLKVTLSYRNTQQTTLTCSTTCTLSNNPTYIWYRNGQPVSNQNKKYLYVSNKNAGSYSCAVREYEELLSPAVCVYNPNSCWSVTYFTHSICALIGSSVEIHSYYTFPDQKPISQLAWYTRVHPQIKELSHADDRVEFSNHRANVSTLRLKHLTENDTAEYLLRLKTPYGTYRDSSSGVSLSVTGLQVNVEPTAAPVPQRQTIKLICSTTCTLSNNPTYIWYRNRQPVSNQNSKDLYVYHSSEEAGSYSCAVRGYEELPSPAVYPPRDTRAVMVPSGQRVEGDSVTLTCSSDANPPVLSYSWFKQREVGDTQLGTDQNYSITNISSQHSGLYYCTVHNQLGQENSSTTHLDVFYPPRVPSVTTHVSGDSMTLMCYSDSNPISSYSWYKNTGSDVTLFANGTNLTLSSGAVGLFYCTAQNQYGSVNSSDCSIPTGIPAGTYASSALTVGVFLTLTAVCLWMRRRAEAVRNKSEETSAKHDNTPMYDNVSAMDMTSDPTASSVNQDDIQYSSVHFTRSHTQEVPLYSTVQLPNALNLEEEVEYTTVNFTKTKVTARMDETPIYSTVQRI